MREIGTLMSPSVFRRPQSNRNLLLLYISSIAWMCGIFIFMGLTWILPIYFGFTYIVLSFALVSAIRSSRDLFNPLMLFIVLGLIRFTVPGVLAAMGTDPGIPIFETMGIRNDDWMLGHALALMGLLGLITGWALNLKMPAGFVERLDALTSHRSGGLPLAALLGMAIGVAGLAAFVASNMGIEEAIYTGGIRGSEIQVGTGKYYYLAFTLSASAVVLCAYLCEAGYVWWISIVPPMITMISFSILGGRVMAFVPMAAAALVVWHRSRVMKSSMRTAFAVGLTLLPVFAFVGQIYRGGLGVEGVAESLSLASLIAYFNYAVWIDWGNLHSMAAAVMIGPGVLGGRTFSIIFWPLSEVLGLPGQSAGVLMVESLIGLQKHKWAFHSTLIGDGYLNFGVIGVVATTLLLGIVLRILYEQIKDSVGNFAIYSFAFIYCIRIFYESIEVVPEALWVLGVCVLVARLARLLTPRLTAQVPYDGANYGRRMSHVRRYRVF